MNFDHNRVDPSEAPIGYYAISKAEAACQTQGRNICEACDWRPECQKLPHQDYDHTMRCMGYPTIRRDKSVVQRNDSCSVVFKRQVSVAA